MFYLKKEDIHPGAIVKVYLNGKFEGFAVLLAQAGEEVTYIEEVEDFIMGKCRWLVSWASPSSLEDIIKLTPQELMTQKMLANKKTHRHIHYIAEKMTWESYAKLFGPLKESTHNQEPLMDMDDSNFIF